MSKLLSNTYFDMLSIAGSFVVIEHPITYGSDTRRYSIDATCDVELRRGGTLR